MDRPDPPTAEEPLPLPSDPPSGDLPLADELPLVEPQPASPKPLAPETSAYRLLANIAIGFVSLFLFVRVFAVEPFGVPTGSMAPSLIGNHREGPCPRCGYPVRVGAPR